MWVLHYTVIEPADSLWCCQSFKVIAVMQSFNAEGKRCFLNFRQDRKHWSSSQAEQKLILSKTGCIKLKGTVILNIPDRDHNARVLVSGFYMQKLAVTFDPIFCWVRFFSFPFVLHQVLLQPPLHLLSVVVLPSH